MISNYVSQRSDALLKRSRINQNGNDSKIQYHIQKFEQGVANVSHQNNSKIQSVNSITKLDLQKQNLLSNSIQEQPNLSDQETQIINRSIFQNVQIIGNSYNKAIICFNDQQGILFGLDQHAIHERIRYEYFCQLFRQSIHQCSKYIQIEPNCINLSKKNKEVQYPSIINYDQSQTVCLEITPQQLQQISENINKINKYNIKIVKILQIDQIKFLIYLWPQIFILNEPLNYNIQSLLSLINSQYYEIPLAIDHILMFKACKGAIKFNESLTKDQMKMLIQNLQQCEFPFYCVHGRCSIHPFFCLDSKEICKLPKNYNL